MNRGSLLFGLLVVLAGCGDDATSTTAGSGTAGATTVPAAVTTSGPTGTTPPGSTGTTPDAVPGASGVPATDAPPTTESSAPSAPATTAAPGSDTPLGRVVLTVADDGRRVVIDEASRAELRLSENGGWETPVVDGDSVELVPVYSFASTGSFTWELARRHPGTTVISVPAPSANRTFRLTVDVV
jgi:hypothetical protein